MIRLPRECRRILPDLAAYLYGDLDPDRAASIRRHLDHCAPCRARLEALRSTVAALDGWQIAEPTADSRQALLEALAASRRQESVWARLATRAEEYFAQPLRRAAAVAFAIVILSAGVVRLADARQAPAPRVVHDAMPLVNLGPDGWIATTPGPVAMEFEPPCVPVRP